MSRRRDHQDLCAGFQNLSVAEKRTHTLRRVASPSKSVIKPHLFNINHSGGKLATFKTLHPSDAKYEEIEALITNDCFVIENIVEVDNPFLKKAYELKKVQKKREFGGFRESLLFHGTSKANLNSICNFNFDWRLHGRNSGHKYGKGVSFSTNAKYASCYSDPQSYHKVMIVAKVLIVNACQGHKNMVLPPPGYDTSQKGNGIVTVKYEDNEFYPQYKLHYHLDDESDSSSDDDFYYYFE